MTAVDGAYSGIHAFDTAFTCLRQINPNVLPLPASTKASKLTVGGPHDV